MRRFDRTVQKIAKRMTDVHHVGALDGAREFTLHAEQVERVRVAGPRGGRAGSTPLDDAVHRRLERRGRRRRRPLRGPGEELDGIWSNPGQSKTSPEVLEK